MFLAGINEKIIDPCRIWELTGITKHLGGIGATKRLAELCDIKPGQRVLEIGCGTGYTSCMLAKKYQANIVAIDISSKLLCLAKKRAVRENVDDRVIFINADARTLPLKDCSFDVAIAESVLTLCDKEKVPSEIYRVLKENGHFGQNEALYLKPPSGDLSGIIDSFGIRILNESEWKEIFKNAGFTCQFSKVNEIDLLEDFKSIIKEYGIIKYFYAIVKSFLDPEIGRLFFNKRYLNISIKNLSSFGYGLFVYKKT
ncbi:hypothetical protein CUJ83_00860 [Methanocella sp. CWC-04]|uniref:Methyltransferase type 11 domain-containing protein n=1 Tax=Methanooceanicella nereidis TaxID=2052831 RepID=A0AAP2W5X4_9EURY|nr:class I SAM-dependent methyltransferase [Methanocella sp. CWC-04]MCD1293546.1 hypothetical protein [Methanocella sp. CWC-04]